MKKFLVVVVVMMFSLSMSFAAEDKGRGDRGDKKPDVSRNNDRNDQKGDRKDDRKGNDRDNQKKGDYQKNDRHDNDRDEKKSNPWNFFQKRDRDDRHDYGHRDYDRHDNGSETVTFSINLFGLADDGGHWETRIVGYNSVLKEIYHPAVMGKQFDWHNKCYVTYQITPAWTERVWVREPVFGKVWVRD